MVINTNAKHWEDPQSCFGVKSKEVKKPTFFGHLIPYHPRLRIFSEKQSCSNNGPYRPLHTCKISEDPRSHFGVKYKEVKKDKFFGHLIYNPRLRIFLEKQSCSNNGPYCPLHSCKKLERSLEPFWS